MKYRTEEQEQLGLLKGSIYEFVEEDSKARFIVRLLKELDITTIRKKYSAQGGKAIEPRAMLGLLFLGYSEGIRSSRELEKMSKKHLDFIYVSAGQRPDHSTICRFQKNNDKEIIELFTQLVKLSKAKGIGDYKSISMDGTKIQARCSKRSSYREEGLEKFDGELKRDMQRYLRQLGEADVEDENEITKKIEKVIKKRKNVAEMQEELKERKKKIQPKDKKNHQINIVEPEAMMMNSVGETGRPGYNAQIAVDTKSGLIVSNYITQDRNDEKQFTRQIENIENNIGEDEERKYQADSGYFSFDVVKTIEERKINAYIPDPRNKRTKERDYSDGQKITKKDFNYNREKDFYECPNGKKLIRTNSKRKNLIIYRTYECKDCKYFGQCNNSKEWNGKYREILRDIREDYADIMNDKVSSTEGKKQMKIRQASVEPVFGNIKSNFGYRRFLRHGIESVECEFTLMCIGHNLNKLFKTMVMGYSDAGIALFLGYIGILVFLNSILGSIGRPREDKNKIYIYWQKNGYIYAS